MTRTLKWLAGIDIVIILFCAVSGRMDWLYNTQIGYLSSALVLGASMFSYSQMVYRRLEEGDIVLNDDRDMLDKIEDPYDLYSEETFLDDVQALKNTIKEEKQKMKQERRSLLQTLKDSKASLSFVRLGAYLLLFAGFFYLSSNRILHIPSYLLALTLPIVIIVGLLMTKKETQK